MWLVDGSKLCFRFCGWFILFYVLRDCCCFVISFWSMSSYRYNQRYRVKVIINLFVLCNDYCSNHAINIILYYTYSIVFRRYKPKMSYIREPAYLKLDYFTQMQLNPCIIQAPGNINISRFRVQHIHWHFLTKLNITGIINWFNRTPSFIYSGVLREMVVVKMHDMWWYILNILWKVRWDCVTYVQNMAYLCQLAINWHETPKNGTLWV